MFQVLELCSGGDLAEYYLTPAFGDMGEFLRVCQELLSAVVFLHENQIAHRDLKPANVLLSDKTHRHVKLGDFGLAKSSRPTLTRGIGTPAYMVKVFTHTHMHARAHFLSALISLLHGSRVYSMVSRPRCSTMRRNLRRL
jgi:tRNA A-37 threonylcarbamoyl transferase component Bud32